MLNDSKEYLMGQGLKSNTGLLSEICSLEYANKFSACGTFKNVLESLAQDSKFIEFGLTLSDEYAYHILDIIDTIASIKSDEELAHPYEYTLIILTYAFAMYAPKFNPVVQGIISQMDENRGDYLDQLLEMEMCQ